MTFKAGHSDKTGFATRAIHHGYDPEDHEGALVPPMHLSSTFTAPTSADLSGRFSGETEGHFYSRVSNPTLALLETRMADLEGAEAALGAASGMGAITSALWTLLAPGDELIVDRTLYGCTFAYMTHGLAKFGVKITHVDLRDQDNLEAALSVDTKLVYFETPANPSLHLIDIARISDIAHAHGARVMVDSTFSTPFITRPIEHGADYVVHSATKYLGGHGDLMAGFVCGSQEDITAIRLYGLKDMTGAVMAPFNAMLLMRGLKTLELRMERHCASAGTIADLLDAHADVEAVYYPGLKDNPQHALACKQMHDFGGMVAFEMKGGFEAGRALMDRLNLIHRAVSLGDAESLIQHPASMTHATYTPEERAAFGISVGLVRLSVGLETCHDLCADLTQALGKSTHAQSRAEVREPELV